MTAPVKRFTVNADRLIFRNLSGKPDKLQPAAGPNFSLLLEPDEAEELRKEGWNVKGLRQAGNDDKTLPFVQIYANRKIPPKSNVPTSLFDNGPFHSARLVVEGYAWSVNDKHGVKAYVRELEVFLTGDDND